MLGDALEDLGRGVCEAQHADGEEPEQLFGEEVVTCAAGCSERLAVVGEVVTGVDDLPSPVVRLDDDEVQERLSGKAYAFLDALRVLDRFPGRAAVLVEGVERRADVHDAVFEDHGLAVAVAMTLLSSVR